MPGDRLWLAWDSTAPGGQPMARHRSTMRPRGALRAERGAAQEKEGPMAKAIHMMVRVLEEARSVAFYSQVLGLSIADRVDFPDFTLIYLRNPEADFE